MRLIWKAPVDCSLQQVEWSVWSSHVKQTFTLNSNIWLISLNFRCRRHRRKWINLNQRMRTVTRDHANALLESIPSLGNEQPSSRVRRQNLYSLIGSVFQKGKTVRVSFIDPNPSPLRPFRWVLIETEIEDRARRRIIEIAHTIRGALLC